MLGSRASRSPPESEQPIPRRAAHPIPPTDSGVHCLAHAVQHLAEHADPDTSLRTAVQLFHDTVIREQRSRAGAACADTPELSAASPAEARSLTHLRCHIQSQPTFDAFWLGETYQHALDTASTLKRTNSRRAGGIFYTPSFLVDYLTTRVCQESGRDWATNPPRTLDPACGCGGFLVGIARALRAIHPDIPARLLADALHGTDIDPLAVTLCRLAIWLEFADLHDPDDTPERWASHIRTADALLSPPDPDSFDLILGNPPFRGQLARDAARSPSQNAQLRARFGDILRPYTDPAALFLHLSVQALRPGGRLGMVLPVSTLGSRDAEAVRAAVTSRAAIRSLWLDRDQAFNASVHAVAITLEAQGDPTLPIARTIGDAFTPAPHGHLGNDNQSWSALAAELVGVPTPHLATTHTIEDLCDITAGFRDEYYAVVEHLRETPDPDVDDQPHTRPVVNVGMIDPAHLAWGQRPHKIGGRTWATPCVTVPSGNPVLDKLADRQHAPKLLVATQTRILEAVADPAGVYLTLTPVISVIPHDPADLWRIGALLTSPVASAWLASRTFGTARALDALKPSAALLRQLPLPQDAGQWHTSADHYKAASEATDPDQRFTHLLAAAHASTQSYHLDAPTAQAVLRWWTTRAAANPSNRRA